jgi:hypothetical protein
VLRDFNTLPLAYVGLTVLFSFLENSQTTAASKGITLFIVGRPLLHLPSTIHLLSFDD